jgi:hypothetical protein
VDAAQAHRELYVAKQYTVNTSVQAGLSRFMSGTTAQIVIMFCIKRSKTNHKSSSRRPHHKSHQTWQRRLDWVARGAGPSGV